MNKADKSNPNGHRDEIKNEKLRGQQEQVPAYGMRIRATFIVVCIRPIIGAASRGKQEARRVVSR
jgi:hypothetical protein